jgi:guanylate kinase
VTDSSKNHKLIVFTAPSGSGKTTIVRHLISRFEGLAFSVSATNRKKRKHENHGKDYYFLSTETFQMWIDEDAFVEWEEVYEEQYYGTVKFEIERLWALGKHVIFDIDVRGASNIKKLFPVETTVVFIKVPSMSVLIERLKERKTESDESLKRRIGRIKEELTYESLFDRVLINDQLDQTKSQAENIITELIGENLSHLSSV